MIERVMIRRLGGGIKQRRCLYFERSHYYTINNRLSVYHHTKRQEKVRAELKILEIFPDAHISFDTLVAQIYLQYRNTRMSRIYMGEEDIYYTYPAIRVQYTDRKLWTFIETYVKLENR